MRPSPRWKTWVFMGAIAAFPACKKHEAGQACTPPDAVCVDAHTGLFCRSGRLATMTCLGPTGCQAVGSSQVACDNPTASVGDGCNQEGDSACTLDRASALTCKGGVFVVAQPCKGPRGCTSAGDAVYCDNAIAEPGDLCTEEADPACKGDRTAFMKCQGGRFRVTNGCKGPRHCTVVEKPEENKEHFECDDSVTDPGDPCEDEGEASCSVDKKTLHLCKGHAVVVSKTCPPPSACVYDATSSRFACDLHRGSLQQRKPVE